MKSSIHENNIKTIKFMSKNNFTKLLTAILLFVGGAINYQAKGQCATPTAQNKCCGIGVVRVDVYGQFQKTTKYNQGDTYFDYFNSTGTCLNLGDTVYMAAEVGTYSYQQAFMYIDWNRNDTFESAELLLQNSNLTAGDSLYGSFIVPLGIAPGAYRMRIGSDYGGMAVTNNPCLSTYGDFWDFQIDINADTNYNVAAVSLGGPSSLTIGQYDTLSLTISNHSDSALDSVRVYYSFNGNIYTEDVTGMNLISCGQYTHKFSQPVSPSTSGMYTIQAWVKYPNGNNPDANPKDDTTSIILCTGIQGTFTVDPASSSSYTNYHKLSEVAQLMKNCFISGPVIIKIKAGTYSDSAYFSNVNGLSSTNTITIDGGRADSTIISNSSNIVLGFEDASYITVKNLTINQSSTGTVTKVALCFSGDITEIHVDSCIIKSYISNNNYYTYNIAFTDVLKGGQQYTLTNSSITNSKLVGGYMGVYLYGNYTNKGYNLTVKNCNISDQTSISLYIIYTDSANISNNYIYNTKTNLQTYGIYIVESSESKIIGNKINCNNTGIFAYAKDSFLIQNNFIWGTNPYSMYVANSGNTPANVMIYHNTIRNYAPSGNTGRTGLYLYDISANLRNNIISVQQTSNQCLYIDKASTLNLSEYNNFHGDAGADMMSIGGVIYSAIKDVQGLNGVNNNVFNQQASFISNSSPYNLHLVANVAPLQADSLAGVTDDIDGDQRCMIAPQLGADESKFQYTNPSASFSVQDTVYVSSPFAAKNLSKNTGEYYNWYIDGSLVTGLLTKNLISSGISSTGSHTITLEATNCKGTHDTTITIIVVTPTQAPVVSFYASDTIIDAGQTISFNNYTTLGPQTFNWTITPGSYGNDWAYQNGTDTNSYQPYITFITPGRYNVCLNADNSAGSSQLCKTVYIKVLLNLNLDGSTTFTNESEGRLFDDGGKYGYHGYNKKYDLLISPCAKDVTIEFDPKKFDLGYQAWIGVWDGTDSITGKPLHTNYGFSTSPNLNKPPAKLTAKSGSMYIYIYSSWSTGTGFEAKWYSTPGTFPKPSASYTTPDTVYIGSTMNIKATYWDKTYSYSWDYDNDGVEDATGWKNPYTFNNAGTQVCRLIVTSCGGADTVDRTIVVLNPTQAPVADFGAEYSYVPNGCVAIQNTTPTKLTLNKIVTLIDKSQYGATGWDWDIQPSNNVVFENGTSQSDQNPDVSFTDTGYYTVKLTATNAYGNNVKSVTNFIRVNDDYCYPTCSTFTGTEAGVSMFNVGDIYNVSDIGTSDYWDYTTASTTCLVLGGKYKFNAARLTNNTKATCAIWIDYNIDGIFQSGERVFFSSLTSNKTWANSFTIPTKTSGKSTTGFTKLRISVTDGVSMAACGTTKYGGEYEDYGVFLVDDYEGPVITLIGGMNTTVEQGRTYNDSGSKVTDNIDLNLKAIVTGSPLNTQTLGTYSLVFNAADSSGNKAIPVYRNVTVTADVTAPYIALIGNNPDTADANITYNDPGVVAYDSVDGNVSNNAVRTGSINIAVLGTYQYQYKVADKAGNKSGSISRDVVVVDRVKPVITLTAPNPYTMHIGDVFSEPGYKVIDNYSKNLSVSVNPNSFTGTNPDTVYITYSSTDSAGNTGTAQRMVIVTDNVAPVIKLKVSDTIYSEAGYVFTDPGYTVTDDYDTGLNATVIGSINIMQLGTQTLTYVASDHSGNSTSKTRYIIVQKTKKPVLTLIGKAIDSVVQFQSYTDLGVAITDSFYSSATLQSLLTITGTVNTSVTGTYNLAYGLSDPSNIKANDVTRSVVVYSGNSIKGAPVQEALRLYPNPANDVLNLVFANTTTAKQVLIYNQAGQLVYSANAQATAQSIVMPVNELAHGLYYIAVVTPDGQRQIAKFVKE